MVSAGDVARRDGESGKRTCETFRTNQEATLDRHRRADVQRPSRPELDRRSASSQDWATV